MKISICIPQFNRIEYLKIVLRDIEKQDYEDIEVCISDDASNDDTEETITNIKKDYKFPLVYYRFATNNGYDRNLRKSMELASGDYCFILGNDDTLSDTNAISRLTTFLKENAQPDVGFCNSADYIKTQEVQTRANETRVIGTGVEIALKYYSSFSFVAGLIFKRSAFLQHNTNEFDGSIYVQIYLACRIICNGGLFFTYNEALVHKDVRVANQIANSYREKLPRKWSEFQRLDSGLPSYSNVAYQAISRSLSDDSERDLIAFSILKRIYMFTYPFWLVDFRENDAIVASFGLINGLPPNKFQFYKQLSLLRRIKVNLLYTSSSFIGIITPLFLYRKAKKTLYKIAKKHPV
nr:glycosyltransferase family 2 protein [Pedobacter ureilyticus]